jgi:predicted unusual protein kinase regulating ubiquinone biosynthesis (AarF/ABC1/UbiB family)
MLKNIVKNILFLLNVGFILGTEYFLYCALDDYSFFIERLTSRLASINILYVKVFQAFALNNSLIDDAMNNKLLKFTDNAPWDYSDINLKDLVDVAEKFDLHLGHGYEVPINSGMISLVFKASKKSNLNEKVIIKMKRKNIQNKLDDAIDNLLFSMYILSFIPVVHKYQLAEVVSKNVEIIRHQTNFLEEINNMNRVREKCKYLKYIKIPTAIKEATESYPNVILMEFIEGIKINQIREEDYDGFAKLVVKFGLVTTIVHGLTHGDLHSGNVLFIKDVNDAKYPYKLGVIDFGIIYDVNSQYKDLMFDIFTNLMDRPSRETAIKILNSGIIQPHYVLRQIPQTDYDNIVNFTEEIINETIHTSHMANQIQIYKFLSKFKEYMSKREMSELGIRLSDDFVKSQLVLAMAHGITLTLCKGDFIALLDKCLNELFHTQMLIT